MFQRISRRSNAKREWTSGDSDQDLRKYILIHPEPTAFRPVPSENKDFCNEFYILTLQSVNRQIIREYNELISALISTPPDHNRADPIAPSIRLIKAPDFRPIFTRY